MQAKLETYHVLPDSYAGWPKTHLKIPQDLCMVMHSQGKESYVFRRSTDFLERGIDPNLTKIWGAKEFPQTYKKLFITDLVFQMFWHATDIKEVRLLWFQKCK